MDKGQLIMDNDASLKEGWEVKLRLEVLEIRSGRNQKEVLDPDGVFPIMGSSGKVMGCANKFLCEENTPEVVPLREPQKILAEM